MNMNKKSFVLYLDQQELFNSLTDEIAGKLIKHIFSYVNCEDPTTDDILINVAFSSIKQALKRDLEKWKTQREQRVMAGKKSAAARANGKQRPLKTVESRSTKSTVNVSVSDSVSVNVSDNKKNIKNTVSQKLDFSIWKSKPSEQVLNDWLAMRKRLKANVSQTVINRLGKQLNLAVDNGFDADDVLSECILRNWRGFEYEWISSKAPRNNNYQPKSFSQ